MNELFKIDAKATPDLLQPREKKAMDVKLGSEMNKELVCVELYFIYQLYNSMVRGIGGPPR